MLSLVSTMPKAVTVPGPLDTLTRKLTHLAVLAPDDIKAIELLVDEAIARHIEEAGATRRAMFSRVK